MRLLVLGANGLLGSNVITIGQKREFDIVGTYHSTKPDFDVPLEQFDILERDVFQDLMISHKPDIVINCAAMTNVDACEKNPEQAFAINNDALRFLAECCDKSDVDFVHVSTDYVFDGTNTSPYDEAARTNPIQVYGESKREGEKSVFEIIEDALITRLSFVYGIHRAKNELSGFPAWVRSRFENGYETSLFTDQRITPTRAGNAAETIFDLINVESKGIHNIACQSCVTPYEFGVKIQEHMGADPGLLLSGSQDDVGRAAARPTYTCLDVSKTEQALDRSQPTLNEDLNAIKNEAF